MGVEKGAGSFDERIDAAFLVGIAEADEGVGRYTELDVVHVSIIHRTGREAHSPAVGEFGGEGKAGAATRLVAEDGDEGALADVTDEGVGGAVAAAVGEDYCSFLPAHAVGGFEVLCLRRGEIAVPLAGFVAESPISTTFDHPVWLCVLSDLELFNV